MLGDYIAVSKLRRLHQSKKKSFYVFQVERCDWLESGQEAGSQLICLKRQEVGRGAGTTEVKAVCRHMWDCTYS